MHCYSHSIVYVSHKCVGVTYYAKEDAYISLQSHNSNTLYQTLLNFGKIKNSA